MRVLGILVAGWFLVSCSSGAFTRDEGGGPEGQNSNNENDPESTEGVMEGLGDGETPGAGAIESGLGPSGAAFGDSASDEDSFDAPPAAPGPLDDTSGAPAGPAAPATPAPSPVSVAPSPPEDDGAAMPLVPEEPPVIDPVEPSPAPVLQPGTLTAGTWDDNLNLERFLGYRAELVESMMSGLLPFRTDDHRQAQESDIAIPTEHEKLDIALVIDTTGSMGDELSYLQTEFLALSEAIESAYPDSEQRWSLVVYRDTTDVYVTRWFDFRDDPEEFRTHLAAQAAGGGGDYPEAPDAALQIMNQLAWRTGDSTARLAFWVADAPHHEQNAAALAEAISTSQNLGIHLYPVASSGVDELTELSMRSAAQMTGGRYLFLTDDSGVGGAHKEPSIPCYFVTKLDDAILRMVEIEMSGVYQEPAETEILRTGGDPQDGACTLSSGNTVFVF